MTRIVSRLAAALLVALLPNVAAAQSSTDFGLCLVGAVRSCTQLWITTTPSSAGTLVDVTVRHHSAGGQATALMDFGFTQLAALSGASDAAAGAPVIQASGGAPAPAATSWLAQGDPYGIRFADASPAGPPYPAPTHYIAGCAGGAFPGGLATTPLTTCGGGAAYAFRFATSAALDAALFDGLSLDIYAGLAAGPFPQVVSCALSRQAGGGVCFDFGSLTDPSVPFTFGDAASAGPEAVVPEPATVLLLATGLAIVVAARRRHRVGRARRAGHARTACAFSTCALAACALAACADAVGPATPAAPPRSAESPAVAPAVAPTVAPALLDALADARERLLPTLGADLRPAVAGALAELRAALDAGARGDGVRAVARTRRLLAGRAAGGDAADAPDLAAIGMLLDLAQQALAAPLGPHHGPSS